MSTTTNWRLIGLATLKGAGAAFALTHNPLYHTLLFFLAPFAILAGPFVGGRSARDTVQLGPFSTMLVALTIGLTNWLPLAMLVPLVIALRDLFPNPMVAASGINGLLILWSMLAGYSFLASIAGIIYQDRRVSRLSTTLHPSAAIVESLAPS